MDASIPRITTERIQPTRPVRPKQQRDDAQTGSEQHPGDTDSDETDRVVPEGEVGARLDMTA